MEDLIAAMVPIAGILLAFGIVYINRSAKNKERMALIEKGLPPEEIAKMFEEKKKEGGNGMLPFGLLLIGVPFGILFGELLSNVTNIEGELAHITCAFLFGGIGLVIAHFLTKKNKVK